MIPISQLRQSYEMEYAMRVYGTEWLLVMLLLLGSGCGPSAGGSKHDNCNDYAYRVCGGHDDVVDPECDDAAFRRCMDR